MNPMTMLLLILSLALGTLMTLSSFHWLLAWAGLEISTLAIIPLISKQHHPRATEAATKYFLIQAAASALVIFSASINGWKTGQWDISQFSAPEATIALTLALAMKLALAPFHFWLPEVLQGSTLYVAMTISTWQKLAPTTLLYMNINNLNKPTLIAIGLLSSFLGGWLGLNQTQTRKIMAYSSVAHMGWMFTALALNPNLAMTTLLIYLTLTLAMFTTITMTSSKTLLDLGTTWPQSPLLLSTTMLTLMSLGGLPPLTGFIPKWLILKELSSNNFFMISTMMALSALPSLYFYLRMSHMTTLTLPPNTTNSKHQWRLTLHTPSALPTVILANLLLPITPLILTVC
uniref:NADH-ubiquinone oxidoreductase chain 2 n=1 Tax=Phyllurus amnicola TaxID=1017105 RepID=A0A3G3E833_9SAUR|nr:NADH dehydrogenase subunit 2 [Phyllurus amnicola]AYP97872.1 NADH dehydrogenase subunit 2 [Phyllurus amnicola]AYP97873.1 NADH dehydrogenase subunit 2 [Phyllurus amnicola]